MFRCFPHSVIALLVVGAIACTALSSAQAETIEYKFEQGKKLKFAMTQSMTMSFDGGGVPAGQKMQMDQLTEMTWNVQKVNDDGTASIAQTMDRIKMKMAAPGGISMEFDSASKEKPTGQAAQLVGPIFDAMVGAEFDMVMDKRGEIKKISVPEKVTKALQQVPIPTLREMFSEEGFEKMIQQGSLTFPASDLQPGDEWSNKFEMNGPAGTQTVVTKYRYVGTEKQDGRDLDAFAVEMELDFGKGQAPNGASIAIKNQDSKGMIYFNRQEGRMESSTVEMSMDMEITTPLSTAKTHMKQKVDVQVKPVN